VKPSRKGLLMQSGPEKNVLSQSTRWSLNGEK
jgi:hypothetical protein